MAIVISDTSPLRALAHVGHLELLQQLFAEVLIPPAVRNELLVPRARFHPLLVDQVEFIRCIAPTEGALSQVVRDPPLDPGGTEALALALDRRAKFVLMDERRGRAVASELGLAALGVLGICERAKERKLLLEVAPVLYRLRQELGFFISHRLELETLKRLGETPFTPSSGH